MRIKYYIQESLKNTVRYGSSAFSSVLVIAMAMTVLGVFVWVVSNLVHARKMLSQELGILVFIKEGTKLDVLSFTEQIKKIPGVVEVKYIPKEKALQEISEKPDVRQEISILGFNPLPDSFEVKTQTAFTPGELQTIADEILLIPDVDSVDYGQESLENVTKSLEVVQYFVYMVGTVITTITLLLAVITMRLTLYSRKNDMEILELAGATSLFIRGPLFYESIIYGILGSFLSLSFLYALYNVTKLRIEQIVFVDRITLIGLLLGGILISFFGAAIESYRQLRVK